MSNQIASGSAHFPVCVHVCVCVSSLPAIRSSLSVSASYFSPSQSNVCELTVYSNQKQGDGKRSQQKGDFTRVGRVIYTKTLQGWNLKSTVGCLLH